MRDDRRGDASVPRIIGEAGGPVDAANATLAFYAEDLEPDLVTAELGCLPTHAFKKGYARKPGAKQMPHGAWFLRIEGTAPTVPDELLRSLLALLPADPSAWSRLRDRYQVRVSISVHTAGWNRGFELNAEVLRMVSLIGVPLEFDLYFDDAM